MEISPAKRAILEARLRGLGRAPDAAHRADEGDAPLSLPQERFWFLDRLGQGGMPYTIPRALRLPGGVDEGALERALGEVVRRHEALRATFREVDGVPVQVIAPFEGFALAVEDLSALDETAREAEVRRRSAGEAAHVFDLSEGPLFRARLLRLGRQEHVLLLSTHHIVCDGWSMDVLFRDLWTLYAAFRDGREPALAELPLRYADHARRQRERAGSAAEARQLAYWKEQLAGAPALLELPTDHPRPPVQSFRGGAVQVAVPPRVVEQLRRLARSEGATLYMVVLAAWQALLARYTGNDDVVVGTPVAGRMRGDVQELVGLFMNTLVLRADLSGDPTFRQAVGRVRETVLSAYENQDVPLERLVEALQPERSLSHSSLFQVLFQLDSGGESETGVGGVRVEGLKVEREISKFDLTLDLDAHAMGLGGVLEYSTDLFERGTARRMVEHLERVLEQAASDPDRRLSTLELMGRADRARILGWNRTTARYPADRCLHQLFEAQARATPAAPAVLFRDEQLTCAELDARANRLANHLRRMGVGPEARVGLCMERSPEILVAILGVMKAGGAYVPMDPGHPAERIAYLLEDSGVEVLLTQERLRARLPAREGVRVLAVDSAWPAIAAESAGAPESGVGPENLCYVIYTSGSTGRPKGVAMHHRGVGNYVHWGVRAYGADGGNGAPVFSSMAVDLTITNLLPLFAGRPVRLLPEENPVEALAEVLRGKPGFGLLKITPVHLSLLTPLLTPEEARSAARTLVIGADFLNAEPTLFWQDHAPGVRLMNEYGPTETVVGCSAYVLAPGRHRAGPVPVGHPIQNLRFYVLDARLEPVPVGLPGELYIGGAGVARGYLGRPALSAEKFVPDPFAGDGSRMYRTGDRARWQGDGNLLILGRTDNQVKIRGFRVELGEVEAVLRRHEPVSECLAVVREDRPGDRRLVAYVVGPADAGALREHARRSLPEYMVPDAIVLLDALPQTPTGKLDRRALPAPTYGGPAPDADGPADEVEARLLEIWEELLGVEGLAPTRGFFELGGNSLLALRLVAQVNKRLGSRLQVATLFAGATVRHMAAAIREGQPAARAADASLVPLQPGGSLPPLFCVHPSGRGVEGYEPFARAVGAEQPVFGLRDLGDPLSRPIPHIAADHVRALRSVQPEGPYHLCGWSFGGFVAYEMASQLEREGERVAFVGIVDAMEPELARTRLAKSDAELLAGIGGDLSEHVGAAFPLRAEALEGMEPEERLRRVVEALHALGAAPRSFGAPELRDHCQVFRERTASLSGYAPGPFSGPLTLFRAAEVPEEYARFFAPRDAEVARTLGWSRISPAVEVHVVPGTHNTLGEEPHVGVFAERVRRSLARAREGVGAVDGAHPAEGGR